MKRDALEAGADQYLVKPIRPQELLLWVNALIRRRGERYVESERIETSDLSLEPDSRLIRFRDVVIADLTAKEFDLLVNLVASRPRILSRQFILSKVWRTVAVTHLVDVHLSNLRKKLPPAVSARIQNVSGAGFRYREKNMVE